MAEQMRSPEEADGASEKSETLVATSVDSMQKAKSTEHVDVSKAPDEIPTAPQSTTNGAQTSQHLNGLKLALLTMSLMTAVFVMALDKTVITTAIPKITSDFHSLDDTGWYGSSYFLTLMALQPTFGKLYTHFAIQNIFIGAIVIFEVGSIVCATAPSSTAFIVGRAIAGIGAAGQLAGGMTIIGYTVPLSKRAMFYSILQSMNAIAAVVGPPLGGIFTDSARLTWRFCFWINLPFGALAIVSFILVFQPPIRPDTNLTFKSKIRKMDIPGATLFVSAIICLLLSLQWGGTKYPWSHSTVWGCILGFALLMAAFIALQFRLGDESVISFALKAIAEGETLLILGSGTIPPRILSHKNMNFACLFAAMISFGLGVHTYFLPFYFQSAKDLSAEASGLRIIPYLISITVTSIVTGAAVAALGVYHPFLWVGSAIYTIGSGLLYTLQVDTGAGKWIGYQILGGVGIGSTQQLSAIAIQAVLLPRDMPIGNALIVFFQNFAGSLSISIAENLFTNALERRLSQVVPQLDPERIIDAGATNIRSVVSTTFLPLVLDAYDYAVQQAFILPIAAGGIAFFSTLAIERKQVKEKAPQGKSSKDAEKTREV